MCALDMCACVRIVRIWNDLGEICVNICTQYEVRKNVRTEGRLLMHVKTDRQTDRQTRTHTHTHTHIQPASQIDREKPL